jgi:hypothetical protein
LLLKGGSLPFCEQLLLLGRLFLLCFLLCQSLSPALQTVIRDVFFFILDGFLSGSIILVFFVLSNLFHILILSKINLASGMVPFVAVVAADP